MKTIRYGVFETNSSSEHVLTYTPKEKWERFAAGDPDLVWVSRPLMTADSPINKTDNIVSVKEYAEYLRNNDPECIGSLPLDFVVTFIQVCMKHGNSCGNPINELLYQVTDHNRASNYLTINELSGDFTQVGDYGDKSCVEEVADGDTTYVKARAVWYD